eukprot:m.178518 g.178518  ORF g.178518 m.178518 type:complete len:453 (+) comp16838_c1_seq7:936-2294(+)
MVAAWILMCLAMLSPCLRSLELQPIPVINDGNPSLAELASHRQPYVLSSLDLVKGWSASNWSLQHVASKLPMVPAYMQTNSPRFRTFHDNKELEPYLTKDRWSDFNTKVNVSTTELLNNTEIAYYFSSDIDKLMPYWPELLDDISPHQALVITSTGVQRNLWLGRTGIQTAMHYDASYNVFVQLHGCKRFTLLPPASQVCSYPCLHPSIAHTQADPETLPLVQFRQQCPALPRLSVDCTETNFSDSLLLQCQGDQAIDNGQVIEEALSGYQVELTAGQALLLPPHWWHQVTTVNDSVSFNVWSDAEEYLTIHEIYELPLPLEASWTQPKLLAATRRFLQTLTVEALDHTPFDHLLKHVLNQRWQPLLQRNELVTDPVLIRQLTRACRAMDVEAASLTNAPIDKASRAAAEVFREVTLIAIREQLLGNYVERVAALISDAVLVPQVLECLLRH